MSKHKGYSTKPVVLAFISKETTNPRNNPRTDGNVLTHFNTCIATRLPDTATILVNTRYYSAMTKGVQTALIRALKDNDVPYVEYTPNYAHFDLDAALLINEYTNA